MRSLSRRAFLASLALWPLARRAFANDAPPLQRILFGSCNKPWLEQPLWPAILSDRPDLWIWLGDIVYADTTDTRRMRELYDTQKAKPLYQKLRATCPIIGIWDDHDYGVSNGDRTFPKRAESQNELLDFLDEPAASPRRTQRGAYASYTYGPPGQQVKIILLDGRYFRETPGPHADILGEDQWRWLETQFTDSPAAVHLIGSGNQVLATEHQFEKWADYPTARQRLLDLLVRARPRRPILLSGDRHLGEISRLTLPGLDTPLYDVTSSGMTHFAQSSVRNFWYDFKKEPNHLRVGENFPGYNFGLLTLDWTATAPVITMEIRDAQNTVRCQAVLR